jgi:hypothetical protein
LLLDVTTGLRRSELSSLKWSLQLLVRHIFVCQIDLHALVSRMRIVSSGPVIETAVNVVKVITETYSQPNKSSEEIESMISNGSVDILRSFSEACREEFEQSLQI